MNKDRIVRRILDDAAETDDLRVARQAVSDRNIEIAEARCRYCLLFGLGPLRRAAQIENSHKTLIATRRSD